MKKILENQTGAILVIVVIVSITIYGLAAIFLGHLPVIDKIVLFKESEPVLPNIPAKLKLPFSISRFWDILFIFIFTWLIIKNINYIKKIKNKKLSLFNPREGLEISLSIGLLFGLGNGLVCGIFSGLGGSLFFGFLIALLFGAANGRTFGLAAGLGFCLITGFPGGLLFAVLNGLIYTIPLAIK